MTDTTEPLSLDEQIEQLYRQLEGFRAELAQTQAERDGLLKRTVVAEGMNALLDAHIEALDGKLLAALVLAGEVKSFEYDDRRARAAVERRERVMILRHRATSGYHNMQGETATSKL